MVPIDPEFKNFQFPGVAVDVVLFTLRSGSLCVGLHKRAEEPYNGSFTLPGRFVRYDEPIEETAYIAIQKKCGIAKSAVTLEQLYTFGDNLDRDTRIRTISVVYYALVRPEDSENDLIQWHAVDELPKMGFDHNAIVTYAHERLKNKILWDEFAFNFLSEKFTLTQLQQVYEAVLGEELDKRNFRKKIVLITGLKKTNEKMIDGVHRPASLYTYSSKRKSLF